MDRYGEPGESVAPRIIEALSLQASLQLELLRAELDRDLWALVGRLIPFGVGVPLVGLGYTLSSLAAALAIAASLTSDRGWAGPAAGTAIVGLANLVLGGGITWVAARRMRPGRPSSVNPWRIHDE